MRCSTRFTVELMVLPLQSTITWSAFSNHAFTSLTQYSPVRWLLPNVLFAPSLRNDCAAVYMMRAICKTGVQGSMSRAVVGVACSRSNIELIEFCFSGLQQQSFVCIIYVTTPEYICVIPFVPPCCIVSNSLYCRYATVFDLEPVRQSPVPKHVVASFGKKGKRKNSLSERETSISVDV